ncbi:MAG TPA: enoyl-CoA hydratase/isomerase family protein [Acidimicrobiia bacterium]|nr:enoyl-CoA hydratase/isomerase family protein [Acidimicrobiia bacterium]
MTKWSTILVERHEHVLTVTLNRPQQRNAFDWPMRGELTELWTATRDDRDVRCVVLTGAGEGFCAGFDVGDLSSERRPAGEGLDDEIAFVPGRRLEVPVVVAVNGVCAGGGLHFVADADVAIASERAWFVDPHVNVGQVSGIEPVSLALRVPLGALYRLALLGRGERWDAAHALDLGLVTEVVPADRLLDRAHELASAIAASSPAAVRETRRVLRQFETDVIGPWMVRGWDAVQAHWAHPDAVEGPRAFAERRDPGWEP